jgi:hypothetical protein
MEGLTSLKPSDVQKLPTVRRLQRSGVYGLINDKSLQTRLKKIIYFLMFNKK